MSTTYTVSVRQAGDPTAAAGLTLSFVEYRDAEAASALTPPGFTDLGNGFYSFAVDWSLAQYNGIDHIVFVVDASSTITNPAERYITGRIGRYDNINKDIYLGVVGKWEVVGDQLIIYEPDNSTPRFTFDLFDSGGSPTSTVPARREPV